MEQILAAGGPKVFQSLWERLFQWHFFQSAEFLQKSPFRLAHSDWNSKFICVSQKEKAFVLSYARFIVWLLKIPFCEISEKPERESELQIVNRSIFSKKVKVGFYAFGNSSFIMYLNKSIL